MHLIDTPKLSIDLKFAGGIYLYRWPRPKQAAY